MVIFIVFEALNTMFLELQGNETDDNSTLLYLGRDSDYFFEGCIDEVLTLHE